MAVRIVTDSASDLPQDICDELGIEVVPLTIRFGDAEYVDRKELSTEDFWRKLEASSVLPETAAPSVGAFEETFRRLADAGADGIVCINLSASLSATMQSAQVAAKALDGLCPVAIIDSKSASMGIGNLVLHAAARARPTVPTSTRSSREVAGAGRPPASARRARHARVPPEGRAHRRREGDARLDAVDQADHLGDRRRGRGGRQGPDPLQGVAVHRRPVAAGPRRAHRRAPRRRTRHRRLPRDAPASECRPPTSSSGNIGPVIGVHTGPRVLGDRVDRGGLSARRSAPWWTRGTNSLPTGRSRARPHAGDRGALDTLLRAPSRSGARGVSPRARQRTGRARRHAGGPDRDHARHRLVRRPIAVHDLVLPGRDQRGARRGPPPEAPAHARRGSCPSRRRPKPIDDLRRRHPRRRRRPRRSSRPNSGPRSRCGTSPASTTPRSPRCRTSRPAPSAPGSPGAAPRSPICSGTATTSPSVLLLTRLEPHPT